MTAVENFREYLRRHAKNPVVAVSMFDEVIAGLAPKKEPAPTPKDDKPAPKVAPKPAPAPVAKAAPKVATPKATVEKKVEPIVEKKKVEEK